MTTPRPCTTYKTYLQSIGRKSVELDELRTVKNPGNREIAVVQCANTVVTLGTDLQAEQRLARLVVGSGMVG